LKDEVERGNPSSSPLILEDDRVVVVVVVVVELSASDAEDRDEKIHLESSIVL